VTGPALRLLDALSGLSDAEDETVHRILDAAGELFALFGIRRTSIDDVARRARLSRNTVFRRLGSKDELVASVLQRELRALIREVDQVAAGSGSVTERLAMAFSTTVTRVRANPMFQTALTHSADEFLQLATVQAGPLIRVATDYVAEVFLADQRHGDIPAEVNVVGAAEVIVRPLHSVLLTPTIALPTASEEDLHHFAATQLGPLLTAGRG
jgi:AcrR family transcriptional regulator